MLICSFLFLILDTPGVDLHESQLDTLLILLILGPQSIHCVKKSNFSFKPTFCLFAVHLKQKV